jgi:hypothetical protein
MIFVKNGRRYFVDWFGGLIRLHDQWEEEWLALADWREGPIPARGIICK